MLPRDDVARRAGTSTAVVSYVLNNGPRRVSEATREKVLRAVRDLKYRPNDVARALSAGSTRDSALLFRIIRAGSSLSWPMPLRMRRSKEAM